MTGNHRARAKVLSSRFDVFQKAQDHRADAGKQAKRPDRDHGCRETVRAIIRVQYSRCPDKILLYNELEKTRMIDIETTIGITQITS